MEDDAIIIKSENLCQPIFKYQLCVSFRKKSYQGCNTIMVVVYLRTEMSVKKGRVGTQIFLKCFIHTLYVHMSESGFVIILEI